MLQGKTIVIGVSGGIAAYKAVDIASRMVKQGAKVRVIMTRAACELVRPITFQSITHQPVATDMFSEPPNWNIQHIELATEADLILVAPATYNIIGKVASGIADDLLTTTISATKAPVIFAPAMNNRMYENPIFQVNLRKLQEMDYTFIEPEVGRLAEGSSGKGRLADNEIIIEEVIRALTPKDLAGMRLLVTAGPTQEFIDPVRVLTNPSSGKMGYAIAQAALRRGAQVTLISGPTQLKTPWGLNELVKISTTREMLDAVVKRCLDNDVIIKAAAPMDFRPKETYKMKVKKEEKKELVLALERNEDILEEIGRKKGDRILVGFAAETENIVANAQEKLKRKYLDFIVANDVSSEGSGFGVDSNQATLVFPDSYESLPPTTKLDLGNRILSEVQKLRREIK